MDAPGQGEFRALWNCPEKSAVTGANPNDAGLKVQRPITTN